MSSSIKSRAGIARLRQLVNELGDRDDKLKNDFQLFEAFFENFPIPVTMWMLSKDKHVISQRGNGFMVQEAITLEDMFICPVVKERCLEYHEIALRGNKAEYFIDTDNTQYYVKLVPNFGDDDDVISITGIAWDITTNMKMLECLDKILHLSEDNDEISEIARDGLEVSRLKKMLTKIETI
tara:strand:- start:127 stop:669 length:543 start_codon:yes stop_codon:yes gene_type:complete